MLRVFLFWIEFAMLALFFAACSCDEGADDDVYVVDASRDVNTLDVVQDDDARRTDTICPPEPPISGEECFGKLFCTYEPSPSCHWDCWAYCPSGCSASRDTVSAPCENSRYQCEDGTWTGGGSSGDPCPPFTCLCPDAGLDGSRVRVDSAVYHDDAGSDNDDSGS
jgi:hypothetical protein